MVSCNGKALTWRAGEVIRSPNYPGFALGAVRFWSCAGTLLAHPGNEALLLFISPVLISLLFWIPLDVRRVGVLVLRGGLAVLNTADPLL